MKIRGIGATQAARLVAVLELSRRLQLPPAGELPCVTRPADAANLLLPTLSRLEQEELHVILLNKALALPLLPDWTDYLWQRGRQQRLITLLDDGQGQGYAAWQVKPASSTWQEVVSAGIVSKQIAF